jgi:carboxylesterase
VDAAIDVDPSPFEAAGRPPACLVLHGFTGTPFEVRPVAEALAAAGYEVRAPTLPGHGTSADDLQDRRRREWSEFVEDRAAGLAAAHGPIVAMGLSLGALLALRLAADRPELVRGIVCLAPALRLRAWSEWPLAAMSRWKAAPRFGVPKLGGSDIRDPIMRRANPSYRTQPLRGAVQLYRLARDVEGVLGRISAPILCVHGARDRVVPPFATDEVLRGVASRDRTRVILPESAHVLPLDVEKEAL